MRSACCPPWCAVLCCACVPCFPPPQKKTNTCAQAQDPRLLGPSNAHLPKLVGAFVQVLGRGTDLVDEGVGLRMAGLLHSMSSSIPSGLVEGAYNSLKEKQKANFQAFMAGQVPA